MEHRFTIRTKDDEAFMAAVAARGKPPAEAIPFPAVHIPAKMREHGLSEFPRYFDAVFTKDQPTTRLASNTAWTMPIVQTRHVNSRPMVCLDLDDEEKTYEMLSKIEGLFPGRGPTALMKKKQAKYSGQCIFILTTPVHDNGHFLNEPALRYFDGMHRGLNAAYGDPGYSGSRVWNPVHENYETTWNLGTWTLDELQLLVPPRDSVATLTDDGIGRNNSVHASLLSWRGRPGNWYCVLADTLAAAMKMNAELDDPLVASELHAIAKSAHVFIDAKVASGEQQEGLLERASRCGIASGISRRAKNHARNIEWKKRRDGGESLRSIAGSAGVAPNTVKHSLKSLDNAVASISPDFEISSAEPHYLISSLHTDQKSTKEEEEDMLVFDGMTETYMTLDQWTQSNWGPEAAAY